MIVPHDQIAARTRGLYAAGGLPRGSRTGWSAVDTLYTVGLSQWTVVTGWPGSGKSEWVDALMVNLHEREHWRFAIYSPEHWPLELHFSHILEKYIGKPFNPGLTARMTEAELEDGLKWMAGRFLFCKPERPSMSAILKEASEIQSYSASVKAGVVIDPWNQLEHARPQGMSETEYVSDTLSGVMNWVRKMEFCHLWLIAHPSKLQRGKDGKLPVPTPHDISSSVHFWNKSDNCVCVHRDQAADSASVEIHVQKVKFRHIGRQGMAVLTYDRVTGRYSDQPARVEPRKPYAEND